MTEEIPFRIVRKWQFHHNLKLGDLRAIVAEADRRRLADSASVDVDDHGEWVSGVDPDGKPEKPYPKGNGGHYVTHVQVDGDVDVTKPLPLGPDHVHEYHLTYACACGQRAQGETFQPDRYEQTGE